MGLSRALLRGLEACVLGDEASSNPPDPISVILTHRNEYLFSILDWVDMPWGKKRFRGLEVYRKGFR